MNIIYLETMGGLANRMRLIASGLWLNRIYPGKIICFWDANKDLNCPFDLLFESISNVQILTKSQKHKFIRSNTQPVAIKKQVIFFYNKIIGVDYCIEEKDFWELIWPGKMDIVEIKKKYRRLYFKTFQEFGENEAEFKFFKPVSHLSKIIDDVSSKFSDNTVGVHIRRTDNATCIEESPTYLFIEKMKAEIERNAATDFFLCTDDTMLEEELKKKFGSRIINYEKELSRQTQKGIQDAVVDMFCLSKTKKILGSHWSSFSEIAARLTPTELITLKNENLNKKTTKKNRC